LQILLEATDNYRASEIDGDLDDNDANSDSESDDEEDRVPAYDPHQQERPKLPIYHPGFRLTENLAQGILKTFNDYISNSVTEGYDDNEAKHLQKEIKEHKEVPYHEAVHLAVAGDTGAGKSALLNAILGVLNLNIEVCSTLFLLSNF
jgi:hypothetical protein